jgi:peptidoglycan hydrolase-like protein with peptidoglycan-binding domain
MMNIKTNIYLILISILLSACSEIYVNHVSINTDLSVYYNFNSGFSRVWKSILHALSESEMIKDVTKTVDDTVGVIVTRYSTVDGKELKYINTVSEIKTYIYSYTINLYSQSAEKTKVKIVVNLMTSQLGFYQREHSSQEMESYLREKLFNRICNNLFLNNKGECYNLSSAKTASPASSYKSLQKAGDAQTLQVQNALHDAGYDPGPADGVFGKKTKRALQAYQKSNNLPVTKQVDQNTLMVLGIFQEKPGRIASKPEKKSEPLSEEKIAPQETLEYVTLKETELKVQKEVFSNSLANMPANSQLILIADEGDWYKVRYGEIIGYVYSSTVTPGRGNPPPVTGQLIAISPDRSNKVKPYEEKLATPSQLAVQEPIGQGLTINACTLWSEASITADILADIPKDTPLDILGTISFFYRVNYQGKEGFVYSYFVEKNDDK